MSEPRISARLRILATALLPIDWLKLPGKRWKQITNKASDTAAALNADLQRGTENVSELAVNWVEGQANWKQASAVKAFAEQEKVKIDAELQKRALPADVRKREAEALKAEAEAERERAALAADVRKREADAQKAEADALMTRLKLQESIIAFVERQRASGVVLLRISPDQYAIQQAPPDFDWDRYRADLLRRTSSEEPPQHRTALPPALL